MFKDIRKLSKATQWVNGKSLYALLHPCTVSWYNITLHKTFNLLLSHLFFFKTEEIALLP